MGAGQSVPSLSDIPSQGLHVLRVTPSSPAFHANIEPFFDFVVGFEGDSISSENGIDVNALEKIVESHENRNVNLLVWNSKSRQTRVVPLIPSRIWSQQKSVSSDTQSSSSSQPSLLGLSMRLCQPETASDNVWHVLDVIEGSPAESAGLVPMGDWILGWSGGALGAENDFYDLVEAHVDKPLRVYVYSYDFDTLREVVLIPNRHWGGEGLLGCVFGFGLLHRIPPQPEDRVPGTVPPELQEHEDEYGSQELFVPADAEGHRDQERWNHDALAKETRAHVHGVHNHDPTSTTSPDHSHSSHQSTPTLAVRTPLSPSSNGDSSFSLR